MTRYKTLILDADSTVAGIEGIDWLARRRGDALMRQVASLTDDAMRGAIPLESVYGARMEAIQPTRDDIAALSEAYIAAIAPGCIEVVARARQARTRVVLISGGLLPALVPVARTLGVEELYAVDVYFAGDGTYAGFDERSPLTTTNGKLDIVEQLRAPRPIVAVGDGNTDLAMKPAVDCFVAYVGFIRRETVVAGGDSVASSFADVERIVFGE
jgi:phosphoserine phosphatase